MNMVDAQEDGLSEKLESLDFHHPFTPYEVQKQFMKTVYDVLEKGNGQIGILESPTGTGKSLSLICASLTWLRNYKAKQVDASLASASLAYKDEPQWLIDQLLQRKREDLTRKWEEREKRLEEIRLKEKAAEQRQERKRRKVESSKETEYNKKATEDEDEFLLEDQVTADGTQRDALSGLSKESREVLARMGLGLASREEDRDDDGDLQEDVKIFYTSRTHSQLSQFIAELRRPAFPSALPINNVTADGGDDASSTSTSEAVKLLPLSSRQKLCINPSVARLRSTQAINDRCADLQRPNTSQRCAFLPRPDHLLSATHSFRDTALATIPDIEDLHGLGKSLAVCPYYASRTALPGAEIVTLPYPLLLQKSAREALGIKLEGSVVVVDEAHNVMDAVAGVHAAEIRLGELRKAREMLGVYVKRFGKKLSGQNRVNVGRVGRVIDGLAAWMQQATDLRQSHGIVDANDLARSKGIDQINLFELIQYIQESKLAYKIESYISHIQKNVEANQHQHQSSTGSPVLHTLVSFLIALTNLSSEGRIFYEKIPGSTPDLQLSYLLLSPTYAFSSIASNARAVILAGGTMSPFEDYKKHLFPSLPDAKVTTLSCGHVIPPDNLCVWTLSAMQPNGFSPFEFSFSKRADKGMIHQLGLMLVNVCSVVPDGVVVFFPSYGYLDEVIANWESTTSTQSGSQSIMDRLQTRKSVFRESKGASSDEVLHSYSDAILGDPSSAKSTTKSSQKLTGALLLSIVGGKMSEGINFSDRLGRCVIVVGLPYPNIASPEWKAKTEYIESTTVAALTEHGVRKDEAINQGKQAARDFYENACMRAVNQSIGRAIRHKNDYAAIVLVDKRYGTSRIRGKLPGWIQGGLRKNSHEQGIAGLMGALGGFFRSKVPA